MEDRKLIDSLKDMDFQMLCAVADAIEELMYKDGVDTFSKELVKFDINLHKALKERCNELIDCERRVKEILCN